MYVCTCHIYISHRTPRKAPIESSGHRQEEPEASLDVTVQMRGKSRACEHPTPSCCRDSKGLFVTRPWVLFWQLTQPWPAQLLGVTCWPLVCFENHLGRMWGVFWTRFASGDFSKIRAPDLRTCLELRRKACFARDLSNVSRSLSLSLCFSLCLSLCLSLSHCLPLCLSLSLPLALCLTISHLTLTPCMISAQRVRDGLEACMDFASRVWWALGPQTWTAPMNTQAECYTVHPEPVASRVRLRVYGALQGSVWQLRWPCRLPGQA